MYDRYDKPDYYEVLGVSRSATEAEIKRAYRRLARHHHPDVNPEDCEAEDRFKGINEAYEVLSDSRKREMYDRFGHAGVGVEGHGFGPEGPFGHFSDIFDAFFGGGFRETVSEPFVRRGADLRCDLELTLEEVLTGTQKGIRITRLETCDACEGTGSASKSQPQTCQTCRGSGQVRRQASQLGMFSFVVSACPICRGEGRVLPDPCRKCAGEGRARKTSDRTISIPPGVEDGTRIRVSREGEAGLRGGSPGDLYVVTHIKPHEMFERRGSDLWCEASVTMTQAALGCAVEAKTLDGSEVLQLDEGTQHGDVYRLRGRGLPHMGGGGRGDLNAVIRVRVPTRLKERERKLLSELAEARGENPHPTAEKSLFERVRDAFTGR